MPVPVQARMMMVWRRECREREEASAWRARGWSKGARAGVEEEADAGSRARGRGVIGAVSTTPVGASKAGRAIPTRRSYRAGEGGAHDLPRGEEGSKKRGSGASLTERVGCGGGRSEVSFLILTQGRDVVASGVRDHSGQDDGSMLKYRTKKCPRFVLFSCRR